MYRYKILYPYIGIYPCIGFSRLLTKLFKKKKERGWRPAHDLAQSTSKTKLTQAQASGFPNPVQPFSFQSTITPDSMGATQEEGKKLKTFAGYAVFMQA